MPERVSKDGVCVVVTEYDVRHIDAYGDCIDIDHKETSKEALDLAKKLMEKPDREEALAYVVEKHVFKAPAHLFDDPSKYTTLATFGDKEALLQGNWIE